ncbi:MAG: hydroxymethylbilane synthase [Hyphomicrobiaceae bacterium]
MQPKTIRIGTRGSLLALAQAHEVRDRLIASLARSGGDISRTSAFEIVVFKTSGDRIQDRSLAEAGGKGLFTREIEDALLDNRIDLAVHSMKDMPTELPAGLVIAAILPREDVRDAFVSLSAKSLAELPKGAVVGTSSLRRAAQIRHRRPDLRVVGFRGNVDTRLKKLADGVADATFLACAGLRRLGLPDRITEALAPETMLPAVAQGAIGVEIRGRDRAMHELLAAIDDPASHLAVEAERAFLARLEGSCRTPIAGLAELVGGQLRLRGEILALDGSRSLSAERSGSAASALVLATEVADELLGQAGPDFFAGHA